MKVLIVLVSGFLAGAYAAPSLTAPSATAAPAPVGAPICPPAPEARLVLPALEAVTDLPLEVRVPELPLDGVGVMVVDGTAARWSGRAPTVYPLDDGRRLVYDPYDGGGSYLWDTGTLTDLGRIALVRAGDRGWLVASVDERGRTYSDVDPARAALRPLWTTTHHVGLLGELDGALAVIDGGELLCVRGPGAVTRHALPLPDGLEPVGEDAIRGHRLLTTGEFQYGGGGIPGFSQPFSVGLWILDLDTMRERRIAEVPGAYTRNTAVPHPYVEVRWAPADPDGARFVVDLFERAHYTVDPATEKLR